jgi:hypothetical protein
MLFICHVTIAPENRDESFRRLKEHGLPEQKGAKLLGAWMALTQQETWAIVEADDAGAVMKLYHPWTDLNVHKIEPVMSFEALKAIVAEEF